jgi:hypothetical protein
MKLLLHVLTRPGDPLPLGIVKAQQQSATETVEVVDLTLPEPNYSALVDKIFAADSVAVW